MAANLPSNTNNFRMTTLSQTGLRKATPFSWVSVYFFGFFFIYSYFLPFLSPWLASRGVNSEQIGLILGGSLAVRCLTNLLVATQLKNLQHLLGTLRSLLLGMLSVLSFCSFAVPTSGCWL